MAEPKSDALRGRRLLVVEDEYMIAADLARALEDNGADVLGPAGSIEDALKLLGANDRIDGALLDIDLRGEPAYAIAEALREREVPFIFTTGYETSCIPEAYAEVPRLEKPVDTRALARLLSREQSIPGRLQSAVT